MAGKRVPQLQAVTQASSAAALTERRDARAHRAYSMRRDGKSWLEVAKALKITQSAARSLVADELAEAAAMVSMGSKQELLAMELDRLDALQSAHWAMALTDVREAEFVLRVIRERIDTLNLKEAAFTVNNNTLVVAGTSEEYISALRAIAGGQ